MLVNGERRMMFDCAEQFLLKFSAESIRYCGGPRVPKLAIREVWEIFRQRERMNRKRNRQN